MLPNFGQIEIFLVLLGLLLNKLSKFPEMTPQKILENMNKFPFLIQMREKIVNSYRDFARKIAIFSIESILENQDIAIKYQKQLEYKLTVGLKNKLIEQMNKKVWILIMI